MSEPESAGNSVAKNWDTYWSGANTSAALTSGGVDNPTILQFWSAFFTEYSENKATPAILDIASGNGAVVNCAHAVFGGELKNFSCLDISESAIAMLRQRFPGVRGIVADAGAIGLDDESFDIVSSQFGIEYAGNQAFNEACRLLSPGGQLAFLLHYEGGSIFKECTDSCDALQEFQTANFLPTCIAMFETGFAVRDGADPAAYQKAGREFAPALRAIEQTMQRHGQEVAHGTLLKLYRDVRTIHGRLPHYDAAEVLAWLGRMDGEITEYAGRMQSMCNASINKNAFAELCSQIEQQGLKLLRAEPLTEPNASQPLAWQLIAEKH